MLLKKFCLLVSILLVALFVAAPLYAEEVAKGGIPADHLAGTCKVLPWGVKVWDLPEAISHLKSHDNVLWIDTRPESFFTKGSVRGAVLLPYDKTGGEENVLTKEKLEAAIISAGLDKNSAILVFFCQGPKCHRSYNATFMTVTQWGFKAENVVWFRDGYPNLFKEVKETPVLKRKAKTYISDEGIAQL